MKISTLRVVASAILFTLNFNVFAQQVNSVLHSTRIGTSPNVLSVQNVDCSMIDANEALNTITFIHRNNPVVHPGSNAAQYVYDISKDGGASWTTDIGPITNNPSIDNVSVNGRFPQGVIYNPVGNVIPDSAYLVYSGTWHDGNSGGWAGHMCGRGKLSGNISTYDVHINQINNGDVLIASSMCQSQPGKFWVLNVSSSGSFASGSDQIVNGLVLDKGVWNNATKNVDWTTSVIPQAFEDFDNAGVVFSAQNSWSIAFDPTGQYGWIGGVADITVDGDSVYDPVFWKTIDGGANWTGPIRVDLDSIQGVYNELESTQINGDPLDKLATATFESDLAVDVNGNPHLLISVGNGTQYSVMASGYDVWDITYDASAVAGCNWRGIHLADIWTLRGTMTSDATPYTEDNRLQISRTADGHKLFFFWDESDINIVQSSDNNIPNMFCMGVDVVQSTRTNVYNLTEGDTLWGGENLNYAGGAFGGATFPVVSPTARVNGGTINVPAVFTQIDYNNPIPPGSGDLEPAFWYVSNINFTQADFTQPMDNVAPVVTLNGNDTITILQGLPYNELGATAFDCNDGVLTPTIIGAPTGQNVGIYEVLYIATDSQNNSDTAVRTVIVGNVPVADFSWSFPTFPYRPKFVDQSLNIPTAYQWNFDDGTGSVAPNPTHTYSSNGVYNVCLIVSNSFGISTQKCKNVTITGVGGLAVSLGGGVSVCSGSQVTLSPSISGGMAPYTYQWATSGNALSCNNCQNPSAVITQNSVVPVTVTDGSSSTATAAISYSVLPIQNNMTLASTSTAIDCNNATGTMYLTITNGTLPFTINWGDNTTAVGGHTSTHNYNMPGEYVVLVTDAAGCATSILDTILYQGLSVTTVQEVRPTCPYDQNGKIKLAAGNGVAPYSYQWGAGSTADSLTNLAPGYYGLTVTDAGGCSFAYNYLLSPQSPWAFYTFLTVTDEQCTSAGSVTTAVNSGVAPYTYLWSNSATTPAINQLVPGNYGVTVTDALGCTTSGSGTVHAGCFSIISGTVYTDNNGNCVFDAGDVPVPYATVGAINQNQYAYASTDTNGYYQLQVWQTGTWQLTMYGGYFCSPAMVCGSSSTSASITTLGTNVNAKDFAIANSSVYDLTLFANWTASNPGFTKQYNIWPENYGNSTFAGQALITFTYDSTLVYQSSSPVAAHNPANHTLQWTASALPGYLWTWSGTNSGILSSTFLVPQSTPVTTLLTSTFSISPTTGDCDTSNNTFTTTNIVTGSLDPNEKEVSPKGTIATTDSILTYTIHFQNTGTDSTHFVIVTDTLSPLLDVTSVHTIASSHPFSNFRIKGQGILEWEFNPLRLVDSTTNAEGSKGFVSFRVKKKPNLPIGMIISNGAHIYFDYNAPVATNVVSDTISLPNYIFEIKQGEHVSVRAYPNPFSSYTTIEVQGIEGAFDFELYDVAGRLLRRLPKVSNKAFEVERNELSAGVYFFRVIVPGIKGAYGKLVVE